MSSDRHEEALFAGFEEDIRLYFDKKISDEEFESIAAAFDLRFPELSDGAGLIAGNTVRAWREEPALPERKGPLRPAARTRWLVRNFGRLAGAVPGAISVAWLVARKTGAVFATARRVLSSTYVQIISIWTYVPHQQARRIIAGLIRPGLAATIARLVGPLMLATSHSPLSTPARLSN